MFPTLGINCPSVIRCLWVEAMSSLLVLNEISVTAAVCTVISNSYIFYRRYRTAPSPYLLQTSRALKNKHHSPRAYSGVPAFLHTWQNEHGAHEAGRGLRCTGGSSQFRNSCSFEKALPCCLAFEDRRENECRSVSQLLEFLHLTSCGDARMELLHFPC